MTRPDFTEHRPDAPSVPEEARQRLIEFFATHPAWVSAARPLPDGVCSQLFFAGDPTPWRLIRRGGQSVLEPGEPDQPDFGFVFSEGAIDYMTEPDDATIGDFAVRLYECCFVMDEDYRVELQVLSPISRILRNGYWKIAMKGGWKVMKLARAHGIITIKDVRRVFGILQGRNSAEVRALFLAQR